MTGVGPEGFGRHDQRWLQAEDVKGDKLPEPLADMQKDMGASSKYAQAVDLLQHMLQMDPAARWGIDRILAHSFFY